MKLFIVQFSTVLHTHIHVLRPCLLQVAFVKMFSSISERFWWA